MTKRRKPKNVSMEPLHGYPKKPPTKRCPEWYWQCVRYVDGETVQIWCGRASRAEVVDLLAKRVAEGKLKAEDVPDLVTVGDLMVAWLLEQRDRRDLSDGSFDSYRTRVLRLEPVLGAVLLKRMTARVAMDAQRQLLAEYRGRTPKETWAGLSMAWAWGLERGHVEGQLPRLRWGVPNRAYNHFTPTEAQLADVIPHLVGWINDLTRVQAWTGWRIHETGGIRARDLDRHGMQVQLHRKGKGGGTKQIVWAPVLPEVMDLLVRLRGTKAGTLRVWPVTVGTMRSTGWRKLQAACDAAGVPRFTWHGLRRLASCRLLEAGVSDKDYELLMGHTRLQGLRDYASARRARSAIAALSVPLPDAPAAQVLDLEKHRTKRSR